MLLFSRLWYYATSIITLLTGFRRPGQVVGIFLGRPGSVPAEVALRRTGLRFKIRSAMDAWVIKETCLDADYRPPGGFRPDWTVVDIGAGLGDFTVYAAKQCPQGTVHAYEPLASSFALLEHNLALNGVTNAKAFRLAAASAGGTLAVAPEEVEAVSTRFVAAPGEKVATAVSLAEVLDVLPDGVCDLMKIDCEGCEFDLLLKSLPELLARIRRLSMETHEGLAGHTAGELAVYLRERGFTVQQRPNPAHAYLGFLYAEQVRGPRTPVAEGNLGG
ncbi:MAG: FkbM family methyltransferase [Chloroflexi bacterium]|nr:FkbM family methyltransferase [Chloroflexota bacterium]MCI0580192.1 FkbM family methyltransferase [Chloroflexota bacterium]MCI0646040.1 FkbM family methyltransferase [Chloroflexota bacterium]MCI0727382.1 FkbM family methyltransferase [Chloroflexota bacterium]